MSEMEVPEGWNKVTTLDVVQDPKTYCKARKFRDRFCG